MGFWNKIFGKGGSYFLDDESAKGLGDTEYMKQTKAIRRTYPSTAGSGESFEVTKQVNAMDSAMYDSRKPGGLKPQAANPSYQSSASSFGNSSFGASSFGASSFGNPSFGSSAAASTPASASESAPASESTPEAAPAPTFQQPRRNVGNVDTSMDMFRNMAKKVGR
jgi:hypothetical protein